MLPTETNIAICGHAKHGKSTLAGRLMYEWSAIDDADMRKWETEAGRKNAELGGKDFNQFNLMFLRKRTDTFTKGGGVLDSSRTVFPTRGSVTFPDGQRVTLIDTPGYGQRFVDNIVYGIFIADCAILLVEAKVGLCIDPRTKERRSGTHDIAKIMAAFKVPVIAILVTKMDCMEYLEADFNKVKKEIGEEILPTLTGYHSEDPPIIPISALSGAGVGRGGPEQMKWYGGINVRDVIAKQRPAGMEGTARLRVAIEGGKEVYSPPGVGTVLVGSLETGELRSNDRLILQPASVKKERKITVLARSIQRARSITEARMDNVDAIQARAIVAVATSDLSRKDAEKYLSHGGVLGRSDDSPTVAIEIRARLVFFQPDSVYSGKDYVILPHASRGTARIRQIGNREKLSLDVGGMVYEAKVGERVDAVLRMDQPICVESSGEFGRLTRFVLREGNRIVACGRCTEVIE